MVHFVLKYGTLKVMEISLRYHILNIITQCNHKYLRGKFENRYHIKLAICRLAALYSRKILQPNNIDLSNTFLANKIKSDLKPHTLNSDGQSSPTVKFYQFFVFCLNGT